MNVLSSTRLRVVIVNYNGGLLLTRAVESIRRADWPGLMDIVVVDNASTDESLVDLEAAEPDDEPHPSQLSIIRRETNEGFGANNHGFSDLLEDEPVLDLAEPQLVMLLNPDAMVHPGALRVLAAAIEPEHRIGAAAPKILLDRPYVQVDVARGDVTISEVRVGGQVVTSQCHQVGAAFRLPGPDGSIWRCFGGTAIRVPSRRFGDMIEFDLAKGSSGVLGGNRVNGACTTSINSSALQTITVVQNAGTELDRRGDGRSRGFGDIDGRTYTDRPPAWCGAAVMLHADYLRDVGGFEPRFFLYYEDVDLSLRGIARGWTTVYVPSAVVEHRHSDRASQGTELVEVLQHRNRMLMLMRNAPLRVGLRSVISAMLTPLSLLRSAVQQPRLAGAHLRLAKWRTRSIIGALRRMPWAFASRRTIGKGRRLSAKRVLQEARAGSTGPPLGRH